MVKILNKLLKRNQIIFNNFISGLKKPRIKIEILQLSLEDGGLAVPNVIVYYHAAMLSAICSWWVQNRHGVWMCPGRNTVNIPVPLKECMLCEKDKRKEIKGAVLNSYKVLKQVRDKLQNELIVYPSPLMSLLDHADLLRVIEEGDFLK